MQILRVGSSGDDVKLWQNFLIGQGANIVADGDFGPGTESATKDYQTKKSLPADGVVGRGTLAAAITDGFGVIPDLVDPEFPPKPDFPPLITSQDRGTLFGYFNYVSAPTPGNPEAIRITNDWATKNLVVIQIPQLVGIPGASSDGSAYFHRLIADQVKTMWARWESEGLLPLVKSWAGSYAPRFVRGSRTYLSNHAYGTAFDINAQWNPLGAEPAAVDAVGSVRKLVPIANECGFYWGGHFGGVYNPSGRSDGMHFEAAKIL